MYSWLGPPLRVSAFRKYSRACDEQVAAGDLQVYAAARTYADKRIRAAHHKLLHRDCRRGTSDTSGAYAHLLAVKVPGVHRVLAVAGYQLRPVELPGYFRNAPRVAWKYHVSADVPFSCFQVETNVSGNYAFHDMLLSVGYGQLSSSSSESIDGAFSRAFIACFSAHFGILMSIAMATASTVRIIAGI